MDFRIHMDNIKDIQEKGKRVTLVLKNGVKVEDRISNFTFDEPWVYHVQTEKWS